MLFKWLGTLPLTWQVTLPILFMVFVVIIALYGKMWFTIGKNKIGIGKDGVGRRRSCVDCSKFHRAEAAKVNRKISILETGIIKKKMNFAEQKLIDLRHIIYTEYSNTIKEEPHTDASLIDLSTRVKLVVTNSIKNEIRRSIKENGFHEHEGQRFIQYAEQQSNTLIGILEEELMTYYDNDMIISLTLKLKPSIMHIVYDIYNNAKNVEIESLEKISELESKYDEYIDTYAGLTNV